MSERFRLVLFIIFSLTALWFTIILLCLPQSGDQLDQWQQERTTAASHLKGDPPDHQHHYKHQISPPNSPDFMRFFRSIPTRQLTTLETLFYEFDPLKSSDKSQHANTTTISKSEHDQTTLGLNTINNPIDKQVKSDGYKLFAFNMLLSNRIGITRPLPDTRPAKCPRHLPYRPAAKDQLTSIIICYYNEAPSALLRTIQSIVSRTPLNLIKELIVVDDFSEPGYDMDQIQPYTSKLYDDPHLPIRFARTSKREGLIRARLFGSTMAQGDVLVFLDSHVEANVGWLEPLLEKIQENRSTIACPMIDLINADTMIYSASPMVRGGLTWALHFKWDAVPSKDLRTYDDFAKPIKSPSMAGGLYAIDREFFNHLGAYDPGMNLWGGENIEMSLRTWMCGGQILILPCSRLGHIFRKKRPYGPAENEPDSLLYNSHRSARVWLDEHVEKFFATNPAARSLDTGDVGERLELRQRLKCHNFTWFIDEIYPALRETGNEYETSIDHGQAKRDLLANSRRLNRSTRDGHRSNAHHLPINEIPLDDAMTRFQGTFQRNEKYFHMPIRSNARQPALFNPARQEPHYIATFQIQLINSNLCIELKTRFMAQEFSRLILDECAEQPLTKGPENSIISLNSSMSAKASLSPGSTLHNQLWSETEWHYYLLGGNRCLVIIKNLPLLRRCDGINSLQAWSHQNQTIGTYISDSSGNLCLAVERVQRGEPIIVTICDKTIDDSQASPERAEHLSRRLPIMNLGRQHARHRQASSYSSNKQDFSDDGGSWLTGPLSLLESMNHRRGDTMKPSHRLHQKWNLIMAN